MFSTMTFNSFNKFLSVMSLVEKGWVSLGAPPQCTVYQTEMGIRNAAQLRPAVRAAHGTAREGLCSGCSAAGILK